MSSHEAVPAPGQVIPATEKDSLEDDTSTLSASRHESFGLWSLWRRHRSPKYLDAIATQSSVFDDPLTLEKYRPPPTYENAHRFDPSARWVWREENRVIRKLDLRIMVWAFILFFALDLDRTNIKQANSDSILNDLHMTTDDYNLGNTLYRLAFLLAEVPCQVIGKRVGTDVWIPCQVILWSIVSTSQYALSGRASFLATRFLLGLLQGGFVPNIVLYLSYFYKGGELPIRLAWFWVSNYLTDISGAFLGAAILLIHDGKQAWRYLFLIEGAATLLTGIMSFFMMPRGPTQTKTWFRPNGWFTDREEIILVNRLLRDDPSKSDSHNREGVTFRAMWRALQDWHMWPVYIVGLVHLIPSGAPQNYLTLTLRDLGFNTIHTNLLSIPSYVIGMVGLICMAYLSEAVDSRSFATVLPQIITLPSLIALYTFTTKTSHWASYAVITLVTGFPYINPIQLAWVSRNANGVMNRTLCVSIYNIFVQAGAMIYANIYQAKDKPLYKNANRALIGVCCMNIVLYGLVFYFYRAINRRRAQKWDAMTDQERRDYINNSTDEGNQRLDFRFAY